MFYIDEDETNDLLVKISKDIENVVNLDSNYENDLSIINNSGLYKNGVGIVSSQIKSVLDGLQAFRNKYYENTSNIFSFERSLVNSVDNIYIPTDLDSFDASKSLDVSLVSLSKNDGRSVNEGGQVKLEELQNEYDTIDKKNISIFGDGITKEEELKDYHDINEEKLHGFNEEILDTQSLEEINGIKNDNLVNINNNNVQDVNTLSDYNLTKNMSIDSMDSDGGER